MLISALHSDNAAGIVADLITGNDAGAGAQLPRVLSTAVGPENWVLHRPGARQGPELSRVAPMSAGR